MDIAAALPYLGPNDKRDRTDLADQLRYATGGDMDPGCVNSPGLDRFNGWLDYP